MKPFGTNLDVKKMLREKGEYRDKLKKITEME